MLALSEGRVRVLLRLVPGRTAIDVVNHHLPDGLGLRVGRGCEGREEVRVDLADSEKIADVLVVLDRDAVRALIVSIFRMPRAFNMSFRSLMSRASSSLALAQAAMARAREGSLVRNE